MFYTWDFMHKEISVTSKMLYFMVPPTGSPVVIAVTFGDVYNWHLAEYEIITQIITLFSINK